jgi:hypothetical protein
MREKYMVLSQQSFPYTTAKYLNKIFTDKDLDRRNSIFTTDITEQDYLENEGKFHSFFFPFLHFHL